MYDLLASFWCQSHPVIPNDLVVVIRGIVSAFKTWNDRRISKQHDDEENHSLLQVLLRMKEK